MLEQEDQVIINPNITIRDQELLWQLQITIMQTIDIDQQLICQSHLLMFPYKILLVNKKKEKRSMDFGKALSVLLHAVDIKIKENNEDTPPFFCFWYRIVSFVLLLLFYMNFSKKLFNGVCCTCVQIVLRWSHLPFNFLAVLALFLVLCPLTGKPIACRLPM